MNSEINRLIQSLEVLGMSTSRVDTLDELSFQFYIINQLENAQQYALEAGALANKIGYLQGIGSSQVMLGNVKKAQLKYDSSEYYYNQALKHRIKVGYKPDISRVYYNLGLLQIKKGRPFRAIHSLDSSLVILNNLKSTDMTSRILKIKAKTYNVLGLAYKHAGKYKDAEFQFEKSIGLYKNLGIETNLANSYMNLGSLYCQEEFTDTLKSKEYLDKSLEIFVSKNHKKGQVQCWANLGNLFFHQNKNEEALAYYAKAKEEKGYLDSSELMTITKNEGSVFYNNKNYDKALEVYEKCLEGFKDLNNKRAMAYLYCDIGNVYFELSEFDKADSYLAKSLEIADDLKLFGLKIASLSSIKNVQERVLFKEQLRRRAITFVGVLALAMLGTIAGFLIYMYRKKRQLAEQKALLFKQEVEVLVGNQVLKTTSARLEGIEEERKRIASDLHDKVGLGISTAKLYFAPMDRQLESLEEKDRDKYQKATQILDETYDAVRRISHDMASPSLSNLGLVNELQMLVDKIEETKRLKINFVTHEMQERLDNNIEIQLYRIIQELLTNALKYAKASEINIELNHFGEFINVIVEDNGIGFDPKTLAKQKNNGLGIENIKNRLEKLKGTFTIDSKKGRGTSVTLDVPLKT